MRVTLAEIDHALAHAQDRADHEVVLLWAYRAMLLGVPLHVEQLPALMGITPQRADELRAVLIEHGYLEPTT